MTTTPPNTVARQRGPMRLPLAPLLERFSSMRSASVELGVDRRQLYRWREYGVTLDQADDLAGRLALLPVEVWGSHFYKCVDYKSQEKNRAKKKCPCGEFFSAAERQRYCSKRCQVAAKQRRWRAGRTEALKAAERARNSGYKKDAARAIAIQQRDHYRRNRDRILARQRAYDRERARYGRVSVTPRGAQSGDTQEKCRGAVPAAPGVVNPRGVDTVNDTQQVGQSVEVVG